LLALSNSGNPVSAATYGAESNHLYLVWGVGHATWIPVNVVDAARTREFKSSPSVMIMDWHYNDIEVINGDCGYWFPFCFDPPYGPQIRYWHSTNSYTLTSFSYYGCRGPQNNLISCWRSWTWLGWATWPVNAEGRRTLSIEDYPEYKWSPYGLPWKDSYTATYQVY
jgi:hypothetical protein